MVSASDFATPSAAPLFILDLISVHIVQLSECMEFTDKIQWAELDSQNKAGASSLYMMDAALLTSSITRRITT